MKKSRVIILLTGFILALLAVCWSRAQSTSQRLKVLDDKGAEVHTLMSDRYNALIDYLEGTRQTNAIEMLRQYRCAYNADTSSTELRETVAALQDLRAGRTTEAIQLLERHMDLHAYFMCNSYGCLNVTNRGRVQVDSVKQALAYYAKY